ncbi:DNA-binding CsgD family transcriptional regulator [Pseudaminobacter salicylatoxidans]|uniref:DNA-binding CsgD family transcriptional regulator n=1 Tax=Pseudaminobacter salicylatoxidans TaxID=93369 RepID=A0A316C187_PSESE|nr:LuxR C-terminal-related transcriptional regulator [Pseudaminobacter salicylatoxidans]PWJ82296.1 DNA-binding CsgD family transcriptional regulator [Pseudaminobacter salicylatoxidans]
MILSDLVQVNATTDDLNDLVYAALLGEVTWKHFLDQLAGTLPGGKAALVIHDNSNGEGYTLGGCQDGKVVEQYNSYYGRLNPLQPPLSSWTIGIAGYDEELLPREELVKTEFYNDFLVPHGLTHTSGVRLARSGSQSFSLVVAYDGAQAVQRSIRTLNSLAPHLKRAFAFYHRKGQQPGTANVALDTLGIGAIFTDGERRVVGISKAAQTMLAAPFPIHVSIDGRLRFRKEKAEAAYEQMLKRHYNGPRSLDFFFQKTKVTLVRVDKESEPLYFEGGNVVIILERFGAGSASPDLRMFSHVYRLSKGEMRALSGIFSGKSLDQIALEAALSKETIRSQSKSLYAKTGTTGAADILRLLHRYSS